MASCLHKVWGFQTGAQTPPGGPKKCLKNMKYVKYKLILNDVINKIKH